VEQSPHMETIQVVIDTKLLRAADSTARRIKLNRSALIREALRQHLKRLQIQALEDRDRRGYVQQPQPDEEAFVWEAEAEWPAE
jgi:metal-responsive CopG/Arc/MetJ family transcriptional regulator